MRQYENSKKMCPQAWRLASPWLDLGERCFDASFRFRAQLQSMAGHKFEEAQKDCRIFGGGQLAQKDAAFHHRKISIGQTRLAVFEQPVKTRSCGRHFIEEPSQPVNRSHVSKITAHPFGRRGWQPCSQANSGCSGLRLQFVGQSVEIPALAIMQKTAHGRKKIHRCGTLFSKCGRQKIFRGWPSSGFFQICNKREPACHLVVAYATRILFYVWFQMKNRATVLVVPRLS